MSWELGALIVLGIALTAGFAWYERSRPPANVLAVVAALAALAVIGRLAFAAFPNVKPTTDIVLIAGFALGGPPGFAVGAVTALASNFFLSQGPWTPWQMVAWGSVGIFGAVLSRLMRGREPSRLVLALACALAGAAFGILMDFYQWTLAAEQSLTSYLAIAGTSLPYNLAHVIGNFVFAFIIGKPLLRALKRIRTRFDARWAPRSAATPAALTLLALAVALMAPSLAASKKNDNNTKVTLTGDPTSDATTWLRDAQNNDGGFGEDENKKSNQLFSSWAALALAASGSNPASVMVSGSNNSLMDYIEKDAKRLHDAAEIARMILIVEASGLDADKFGGENLNKDLEHERDGDGSYGGQVAPTAFAMLAQKAAGNRGGLTASSHWLADQANEDDGGFAVNSNSKGDVDVTGAVLQAMEASGEVDNKVEDDAIKFLKDAQNSNGGFGQFDGDQSNSQSTAFAIQGLAAASETPSDFGGKNSPIDYLEDQQDKKDGHIEYGGGRDQTPVWVTSQAILGLRSAEFPLSELAKPLSDKDQRKLLKDNNSSTKTPKIKTPKNPDSVTSTPIPGSGNNDVPKIGPGSPSKGPHLPKALQTDKNGVPKSLEDPSTSPGLADVVPPAFSFSGVQAKPKPPSALVEAAQAASSASQAVANNGETVGTGLDPVTSAPGTPPPATTETPPPTTGASVTPRTEGSTLGGAAAAASSAAAAASSAGA
ncbi:MAG: energy-coupling factor transport system substrate-specific component [Thermoleophilaceae bacterium]|jgi:energy-coupling factor transport system substrate-specific component|nr:energy-coupling factor transport system substrate-specific component [Thermoleophilaceae bacterium]